ncbi:MAG: FYDLN acid domain-containing protein [Rhodospirillales bacterium]|nr:FYDLN acid domain-containing protein [Rhodospirillales bacterium]
MAKPEWGTKRTCHNCGARFYDLRREQIVCPTCNTVHDTERQPRTRRSGGGPKPSTVTPTTPAKPKSSVTVLADDGADDDTIEDVGDDFVEDVDDDDDSGDDDDIENMDQENRDLIEDTSDLGEDDDDIGEVIEHIDDDVEDRA